ncbi:MAG: hypothetical protein HY881_14245 [Deltaproteobacteria bacterium]|nr:hypothetical protein [Deltaproteobacteria bacterium]
MDALKFEPVAVMLRLSKSHNESVDVFTDTATGLFDTLATRCLSEKHALIGHIKGFATGPEESYLRVSATGDGRPADSQGHIRGAADAIFLALNILVFGISAERIRDLLSESIIDVELLGKSAISFVNRL